MNTEDSAALRQAKAAMRREVQADLYEKLRLLRVASPDARTEQLMERLKESSPELVACAQRIEAEDWSGPKPEPIYRYVPRKEKGVEEKMREILNLPSKVEARKPKDDAEVMLVYGSSGEVIDIELT